MTMVQFDAGLRIIFKSSSQHVSCEFNILFAVCEAVLMSGTPIQIISDHSGRDFAQEFVDID